MVRISGIDYSLTSPSVCVFSGNKEDFSFEKCKLYFLSPQKKYSTFLNRNIDGQMNIAEYSAHQQRYDFISDWALDIIISENIEEVYIEDYSYNSTGRVFNIAENCGLLKWKLWNSDINFKLVSPAEIKKFATGKGNANKESMYESFYADTNKNLLDLFEYSGKKVPSPISDIVDSYYICKFAVKAIDNQ